MKRKYLVLALCVGGFMVSCNKANINPITDPTNDAPSWQEESEYRIMNPDNSSDKNDDFGGKGDITDPNSDPDGNKKGSDDTNE